MEVEERTRSIVCKIMPLNHLRAAWNYLNLLLTMMSFSCQLMADIDPLFLI